MQKGTLPKNTLRAESMIAWQSKGRSRVCADYVEDFGFCDNEIKVALGKKSWSTMDKCFKWQFIVEYLGSDIDPQELGVIKQKFCQGELGTIVFDTKERKIKSMGIVLKGGETV
jgi:hypothetical protein